MTEKRETVGSYVTKILQNPEDTRDGTVLELGQRRLSNFEENFYKKLQTEMKRMPSSRDFYLELHHLSPILLHGKVDNFPLIARLTCPAPTFSQVVYIYHRASGDVELVWSVPDLQTCVDIDNNKDNLDPELYELYRYVSLFKNGLLFNYAKKINADLDIMDDKLQIT